MKTDPHPTDPRRKPVSTETVKKPSVLFVCVHNAGRSQMAAAFLTTLSQGAIADRARRISDLAPRLHAA